MYLAKYSVYRYKSNQYLPSRSSLTRKKTLDVRKNRAGDLYFLYNLAFRIDTILKCSFKNTLQKYIVVNLITYVTILK